MPRRPPPPQPLGPVSQAIVDALADGAWHDLDEVLRAGAAAVPPGVAFRKAERVRRGKQIRDYGAATERAYHHGDQADAVASGARTKARESMTILGRHGSIERDGDRVRITTKGRSRVRVA